MALSQRHRSPIRADAPASDKPTDEAATRVGSTRRDDGLLLVSAARSFSHDHMTSIAAALAYYAFLAIPAALLVAVGVFSLLAGPGAVSTVVAKLDGIMPAQAAGLLRTSLENATRHHQTGIVVLVVGAVIALWSLTGAMQNLIWALNVAYHREESRGFVRRRFTAITMIAFALLGFALAFGVLVLGPLISDWVGNAVGARTPVRVAWYIAEWPLLIAGLLLVFAGLMYLGPNVEPRRWRFLTFGSVLALAIWLVASGAFSFYASRFGSYNKTWGALAAVVVMLTWLWLSAVALLFGAEVNAEVERRRAPERALLAESVDEEAVAEAPVADG
jgi:membrane protein